MLVGGMNFVLLYRGVVSRRPGVFVRDEEFRLYIALVLVAAIALTVQIWSYDIERGEEAVRAGVFQAVSIITTTGYATEDFALWPVLCLMTIFALMFVGGSAGSTTGSIKVVRHLLVGKILRRELGQTVSPEVVHAHPAERGAGRRADAARDRGVHPPLRRPLGRRRLASSRSTPRIGDVPLGALDTLALSANALGNGGPGFGITGTIRVVRAARGRVQGDDDPAHVARADSRSSRSSCCLTRHYWRL